MKYTLIIGLILVTSCLVAEIEWIQVQWRPEICWEACTKRLEEQFRKIKGVETVSINTQAGRATLGWKAQIPFRYSPINIAMRMVGPRIREIRLKVRGRLKHDEQSVILISSGDGTTFQLLTTPEESSQKMVIQRSSANRRLPEQMRESFIEAEEKGLLAVVEGILFQPHRSPELQLVIEQFELIDPKTNDESQTSLKKQRSRIFKRSKREKR